MSEKQFYLLQVNDALFPIGGYSHSQGLETYIQRGIVHNVDTAREYITHKIKMESCVYRTSGSQTCIRSRREKRPAGTSVPGRTSGSIQNSYGTERSCQKNGFPFCQDH